MSGNVQNGKDTDTNVHTKSPDANGETSEGAVVSLSKFDSDNENETGAICNDSGAKEKRTRRIHREGNRVGDSRRQKRLFNRDQMDLEVYNAVKNDDQGKLKELIKSGANVDIVYVDYTRISTKSLIHICCEKGRLECVKILIDNGAYPSVRDKWGQTPLMYCMAIQYHEIADLILSRSASADDVDIQDNFGKTALHCAAESGSLESVNVLLKYKAAMKQTAQGITPLMSAVTNAEECPDPARMVQVMLDASFDLEMKDFRFQRTALQMAVLAKNIPAVEILIAAGADVNTLDGECRTPLTNVIGQFVRKLPNQDTRTVDPDVMVLIVMLTQSKSDLNMTLAEYCNPLISSAFADAADLTQYFLDNGADADIQFDPSGATPLVVATSRNSIDVVKVLVRWNCRLDLKGRIQKRRVEYVFDPFEFAVFQGYLEIAKLLVMAGCNLQKVKYLKDWNCSDWYGSEMEIPNSFQQNPEILIRLRELANNPKPLLQACVDCIRHRLGHSVVSKVVFLPIPTKIQNLVTLANVL